MPFVAERYSDPGRNHAKQAYHSNRFWAAAPLSKTQQNRVGFAEHIS